MAYFPLFVELAGRRVLVVGGGRVALRKVEKLLPYEPEVVVVAPEIRPELENLQGVTLVCRSFFPDLLSGAALVIAAAGDTGVNHEVSTLCREQGIPVNVVDDPAACTFFFPALVKRGPLSVGISTGGASPCAAAYIRGQVDDLVPERFEKILELLRALRPVVRASISDEQLRAEFFARLLRQWVGNQIPVTMESAHRALQMFLQEGEES